ncbi:MAG: hypothetical protein SGI89_08980 [bacterium]|nr:hypothetical protein [bacterium]
MREKEIGRYNVELKLFQEVLPPVKLHVLKFRRWLKDTGRAGALPISAPRGEFLFKLTDAEIADHVAREWRLNKDLDTGKPSRLEHMAEFGQD